MVLGKLEKEENAIVEVFDAYASADVNVGYIVTNYSGTGVRHALTTDKGPYFMAMMPKNRLAGTTPRSLAGSSLAYDYALDGTDNNVPCVVTGVVDCAVATAEPIPKGCYVEMSTTAGKVQLSGHDYWYEIVGIAMEDIASASTHGLVLLGTYP